MARNLDFAKNQLEKRELMGDRPEKAAKDVNNMGAMEVIKEAEKTQQEDLKAVVRMQRMVEDTEDVGLETNIKLKLQTEQMKSINNDVYSVGETMKRADKLVNQIGKRLATDKMIACLILTILFFVFLIIVLKSFGYGGTDINGNVIKIDCNLDITKTQKQCIEIAAAIAGGGRRRRGTERSAVAARQALIASEAFPLEGH